MGFAFWTQLDALVQTSELVIDRPKGSPHPRASSVVYPLDYGYLSNTSGGDGNEIDVLLSILLASFDLQRLMLGS